MFYKTKGYIYIYDFQPFKMKKKCLITYEFIENPIYTLNNTDH